MTFFGNLIFAIIAQMLCRNHLKLLLFPLAMLSLIKKGQTCTPENTCVKCDLNNLTVIE